MWTKPLLNSLKEQQLGSLLPGPEQTTFTLLHSRYQPTSRIRSRIWILGLLQLNIKQLSAQIQDLSILWQLRIIVPHLCQHQLYLALMQTSSSAQEVHQLKLLSSVFNSAILPLQIQQLTWLQLSKQQIRQSGVIVSQT